MLVAGMITAVAWKWEFVAKVSRWKRALTAVIAILAIAAVGYPKIAQTYSLEHKSPDDLTVTLSFPDRTQIGKGAIDFDTTFFNAGKRSAQVEEIAAFVVVLTDQSNKGETHSALCSFFAKSDGAAIGMYIDKGNPGLSGEKMDAAEGSHWYSFRSSAQPAEVAPGKIKVISATVTGVDIRQTPYNVINVCPIIRYFDAEGTRRTVVCRGYSLALRSDNGVVGTMYWPVIPIPYRLLPHDKTSVCERSDGQRL